MSCYRAVKSSWPISALFPPRTTFESNVSSTLTPSCIKDLQADRTEEKSVGQPQHTESTPATIAITTLCVARTADVSTSTSRSSQSVSPIVLSSSNESLNYHPLITFCRPFDWRSAAPAPTSISANVITGSRTAEASPTGLSMIEEFLPASQRERRLSRFVCRFWHHLLVVAWSARESNVTTQLSLG